MKNNLKNSLLIALLFSVAISNVSCAKTSANDNSTYNSSVEQTKNENLSSLTEHLGATSQLSTRVGFYEVLFCSTGGVNISYTDYSTSSIIMLCNRAECLHKDDTCTSWFPSSTGAVFMSADEKNLFFIQHSNADAEKGSYIWMLSPNGSDRKLIYELPPQELIIDMIVGDSNNLYIGVIGVDKSNGENYKELRCISIQTAAAKKILNLKETDGLVGAYDNILVFCSNENETITYWTISTNDEQNKTTVFQYPSSEKAGIDWAFCVDDQIVTCSAKDETTANIQVLNMRDNTEKSLNVVPFFSRSTTFAFGMVDNQLFIQATDAREKDPNKIIVYYYSVDLNNGNVKSAPLRSLESVVEPIYVVNAYQDFYHVITGYKQTKAILNGNDGTPYETQISVPQYALISKIDFWEGNANFLEFQQ